MNKNTNTRTRENTNTRTTHNNNVSNTNKSFITTSTPGAPGIVDNAQVYLTYITNKIKNKVSSPLRTYIIIMIPVIIFLCYIVYKYTLNTRTALTLNDMGYKDKLELTNLPQCYELDKTMQYKLCDYYICSSFMTPCIGNQHYDYVSIEMIGEVLQSGARYIQIPICEYDISQQAIPVVATAQYGQKIITSLNSLDVRSVLNVIRLTAFNINKKKNNYPLIIHFILNTNNTYTLNTLSNIIKEILSDIIIIPSAYTQMPIFLEKICNLLGKIILIATPEYQGTRLEEFIMPTNTLFNTYHYSKLGLISIPDNSVFTNNYNNKLSSKQQAKSNLLFKKQIPSIDYVIQHSNSDKLGETILNDKNITNNLINFNKVGITIIKSQEYHDVLSANYNPEEAIFNGCQIVTMNFQINDTNMKNYLNIFKKSSFILKPTSLRFSEQETPLPNLLALYKAIIPKNNNIINDIYYKYNNLLVAFEPYQLPNTYLTQIEDNLKFNIGTQQDIVNTNKTYDKSYNKTYKIGLNQCFLITKSTISTGNEDIPLIIESVSNINKVITLKTNYFDLSQKAKNKKEINKQSMYFEYSNVINENNNDNTDDVLRKTTYSNKLISIRNMDPNNTMYLAYEHKKVKAYIKQEQIEAQHNMAFILHIIPFKIHIQLITIYEGSVKSISNGTGRILGILENNTTDGTSYILEPVNTNSTNFIYNKDQFYMKNAITNTYVTYDNNTLFLYDKSTSTNTYGIFNLDMLNGYYTLLNNKGYNLIFYNNNLLKFVKTNEILTNENLFKIDLKYVLTN